MVRIPFDRRDDFRIPAARTFLRRADRLDHRSATSVAHMIGYAGPSSFTRWFCAEFGVAPVAWRAGEGRAEH